jgi:hypothetical protein
MLLLFYTIWTFYKPRPVLLFGNPNTVAKLKQYRFPPAFNHFITGNESSLPIVLCPGSGVYKRSSVTCVLKGRVL